MDSLFPGKKRFRVKNEKGEVTAQWEKPALDWKANVVCSRCNGTWMSRIENDHAKPALTDLILGKLDIPITESRAHSIAIFAFKSAVVFNHLRPVADPFFPKSARHNFKEARAIPANVSMWMAGFHPISKGEVHTVYHNGALPNGNRIRLYVCTYAVGHFVFQVLAARQSGFTPFGGGQGFEHLAVPFWPTLRDGFIWPPAEVLRTVRDFDQFSTRWGTIMIRSS